MPQIHYAQSGVFHITTKTQNNIPWCTIDGVPDLLIYHLSATREIYGAQLHAFCILPTHIHCILSPGSKGVSKFMQSFKCNTAKAVQSKLGKEHFSWQAGFFDERIRDSKQRSIAIAYVQGNAMKHGLVREILHWPWTSLRHASILDPLEFW